MNISQQVVILSAEKAGDSVENKDLSTRTLRHCLEDCFFKYKEATGLYKGQAENAFVVIIDNQFDLQTLKDFAFKNFGQESILHQDANQEAYLLYADGTSERLGRLEQVTKEEALKQDSYTILNDNYYITRPR